MIIRTFSTASLGTKVMLFKTYCAQIYGCPLWSNMLNNGIIKLRVAYYDAFRLLLSVVLRNFLYLIM